MITRTSHRTTLLLATFAFQIFAAQGQPGGVAGTVTQQNVGGITKMGNGIARKAMIEAAWNNRAPVRISRTVLARQQGLPQAVTDVAWNAQTRLHQRYKHLTGVGRKKSQVAAAALGRELSGFVWAIGRMVKPHPVKPEPVKAA